MTGVVLACVAPHGSEVVPELAAAGAAGGGTAVGAPLGVGGPRRVGEALAGFARLTRAMEDIGRRIRRADPATIVLATPHNLRLDGGFTAVATSERVAGVLEAGGPAPAIVEATFPGDRELARDIVTGARRAGIPVVGVNYGAQSGPVSTLPMDWGALIPLYFMGRRAETRTGEAVRVEIGPWEGPAAAGAGVVAAPRPKVVLIGPGRDAPRESLVRLGEVIAETCASSGRSCAFVASADQGHAHLREGPYGHDPASAAYDGLVCELVRRGRLEDLLAIDPALVEAGKPDSLWQMLVLLGVLRKVPMTGEFLAYEVPTYFGMLCAVYEPRPAGT